MLPAPVAGAIGEELAVGPAAHDVPNVVPPIAPADEAGVG